MSDLTPQSIDLLVRLAADHRDMAAQAFTSARRLVKALRLAAHHAKGAPRRRGRFRNARQHRSLALAALACGLSSVRLAEKLDVPVERIGALFGGAQPTNTEREALCEALPTWAPKAGDGEVLR